MTTTPNEVATKLKITNDNGEVLLEEEIVYLDIALADTQKGCKDLSKEMKTWLPKWAAHLSEKMGIEVSETHAYYIATEINKQGKLLKKSFNTTLT